MSFEEQPEQQLVIRVDDDKIAGAYANIANVWHSSYEFTIDFGVMQPTRRNDDGTLVNEAYVTSRVRLPIAVVYPLLRALSDNIAVFEREYGPVPTGTNVDLPPDFRPPEAE
jgi:hypothetical protein